MALGSPRLGAGSRGRTRGGKIVAAGSTSRTGDCVAIRAFSGAAITGGVLCGAEGGVAGIAEMGAEACVFTVSALASSGRRAAGGRGALGCRLGLAAGEGTGAGACGRATATGLAGTRLGEVTATGTYSVRAGAGAA